MNTTAKKPVAKTVHKPLKSMTPKSQDAGYGPEPQWKEQPPEDQRVSAMTRMFNWYNYHYGKKEAKDCIVDWLARNERAAESKEFNRIPEAAVHKIGIGWVCRANLLGLALTDAEVATINATIADYIAAGKSVKEVVEVAEVAVIRPNIQDRLREKMSEAAGELEGMYDEMIRAGGKMSADYKPISLLRSLNVAPQLIGTVKQVWERRLEELQAVAAGKDADLVEGYAHYGKLQVRNFVKFAEQVIADCGSYVQIKKSEKKPRAKKAVPPEKVVARFKYAREFAELKLKSESATKLVGASEAWLYDSAKRKLIHVVADTHLGTFTVKGSAIVGFDPATTVQKTLRKPAEQIRSITGVGKPAARKAFKEIKATEVKFNGRGNDNLIILKTY
jgi:urease gamma subunit